MSDLFPEIPHPSIKTTYGPIDFQQRLSDDNLVDLRCELTIETNLAAYVDETEQFFRKLDKDILVVALTELGYGVIPPESLGFVEENFIYPDVVIKKGDVIVNGLIDAIKEKAKEENHDN